MDSVNMLIPDQQNILIIVRIGIKLKIYIIDRSLLIEREEEKARKEENKKKEREKDREK